MIIEPRLSPVSANLHISFGVCLGTPKGSCQRSTFLKGFSSGIQHLHNPHHINDADVPHAVLGVHQNQYNNRAFPAAIRAGRIRVLAAEGLYPGYRYAWEAGTGASGPHYS